MQKKISLGTTIMIVVLCCIATFQITLLSLQDYFEDKYFTGLSGILDPSSPGDVQQVIAENPEFYNELLSKLVEIDAQYRDLFIGDIDNQKLIESIIAGYIAGVGDDYAAYYNPDAYEDFINDLNAQLVGIGVNVIYNTEYQAIEIINVLRDSPALEAGVMPGDLVIAIGEEKTPVSSLGYEKAVNAIRGEEGTFAVFTVARGENYSERIDFSIERKKIVDVTVTSHVYALDDTVGIIKISGFDAKTPDQFKEAVEELQSLGCDKLVVDLRYNPGGELNSIVKTLDYILPEGPIVHIMDTDGKAVKTYSSAEGELDMPMAVLVNGSTASAAELFTAAVRDYNKAEIVGTTTFGKGCMQTTIPLATGGAISITYRMYNPPFSENYHGVGIIPDVEVELDPALKNKNIYKITDEEDNQLAAAVATFNN
ncbi:MAG: PDZ domain-containing protein [Clostridia bacterium]|nr:PDZ domain-containing protein [Clostridia bacterium]